MLIFDKDNIEKFINEIYNNYVNVDFCFNHSCLEERLKFEDATEEQKT